MRMRTRPSAMRVLRKRASKNSSHRNRYSHPQPIQYALPMMMELNNVDAAPAGYDGVYK